MATATREGEHGSFVPCADGWVLLANRGRVNNARLVGVCASAKSFGSGFMPVVTETRAQAKALCLVWNSTPVLLQLLNMRTKMLMYLSWSVAQLGSVRVPESLNDATDAPGALVAVYDRLCRAGCNPGRRRTPTPFAARSMKPSRRRTGFRRVFSRTGVNVWPRSRPSRTEVRSRLVDTSTGPHAVPGVRHNPVRNLPATDTYPVGSYEGRTERTVLCTGDRFVVY